MIPTDAELVERIGRRDEGAFALLFDRYREIVRRHLRQIVRDEGAAEDLLQEVFLRVWNRATQWREQGNFRAWLLRVATNAAFTHLRSVRRRREQDLERALEAAEHCRSLPEWMVEAPAAGPEARLEEADQHRLLWGLVERLPEEQREVFHLIYAAEVEVRQAAQELGIPEGTVKSRLHYGRRELARQWRDFTDREEER